MRFDGYSATIRDHSLPFVAESLAESLGGLVSSAKPRRRYGAVLDVGTSRIGSIWAGLDPASGAIYVEAKGDGTPDVVQAIRAAFPDHTVPRVDVCEDYDNVGAFRQLQRIVRRTKGEKVSAGYNALPDDKSKGKTWGVGVRGGVAYMRLYEAGKHPDRVHLGRPDWVRAELEVRPHYARDKVAAATMQPLDVWGMTAWSHKVGEALTHCDISRFEPKVREYSYDQTTRYLALTFRRHWEEMKANGEHFQATIEGVWKEEDQARFDGMH